MKRTFRVKTTDGSGHYVRATGAGVTSSPEPGPELSLDYAKGLMASWRDLGKTAYLVPVWPASSLDVSRTQLIGMLAALRGVLVDFPALLIEGGGKSPPTEGSVWRRVSALKGDQLDDLVEALRQTQELLDLTGFNLDPAEEVAGGFDKSWHFEDSPDTMPDDVAELRRKLVEAEARIWRERRALVALRGKAKEAAEVLRRGGAVDPAAMIHGLAQLSTEELVTWFEKRRLHDRMLGVPGQRQAPWGEPGSQCPSTWQGEVCTLPLNEDGVHYGDHTGVGHWWAGDGDGTLPEVSDRPGCVFCGGKPCRYPDLPADTKQGHHFPSPS